jgi:hypothetical protein
MSVDALRSSRLPQETPAQAATFFQRPPGCAFAVCGAVERGQKELERLNCTEAQLREALAREQVLLDQKDEFDQAQGPYGP